MAPKPSCESNGQPRGWTLETLKAYFELKFSAVDDKIAGRDKALELQAKANDAHFTALNNEAARILKATEVTVSRDTWDGHLEADRKWKADAEKALAVKSGKEQGLGLSLTVVVQIISSLASIGLIISAVAMLAGK